MSATIFSTYGTFTFHIWEGQVLPMVAIPDIYARVGQFGSSVQLLGRAAPPSTIAAFYFTTTATDGAVFRNNLMANLQGGFVNITEPDGGTWNNALIRSVVAQKRNGRYVFNGTVYPVCVACHFIIEAQS